MVRKPTELERSPSSFDVSTLCASIDIYLNQLQGQQSYQQFVVTIKVGEAVKVKNEVKNEVSYQDLVVGDATGSAKLTVWVKNIGALKESSSYMLSGMMVREYIWQRFLLMPNEGAHITTVADIGAVREEELDEDNCCLKDPVVVGVMNLDSFRSCFMYKGKMK